MRPKPLHVRAAEALVIARRASRLTQQDLAKRSGIKQQNISRIESGTHLNVTLETLDRLAKAMEKEVNVVFREAIRKVAE